MKVTFLPAFGANPGFSQTVIEIDEEKTVKEAKEIFCKEKQFSLGIIKAFVFNRKEMKDEHELDFYGIQEKHFILVEMKKEKEEKKE